MRSFHHVTAEIVISHDGAADRCDTDGLALNLKRIDRFRDQPVNNAVGVARAVMQLFVCQRMGFLKYDCYDYIPPSTFLTSVMICSGSGIIPPDLEHR